MAVGEGDGLGDGEGVGDCVGVGEGAGDGDCSGGSVLMSKVTVVEAMTFPS